MSSALVSLLTSSALAAAPDLGALEQLIRQFQATASLSAHFREEKRLAVLAAPLVSEGDLFFVAPNRLAREVTTPVPSKMVIDGNSLSFSDGHGVQILPLAQNSVARAFVDSFLLILSGDAKSLSRLYTLALSGDPNGQWSLRLTPQTADLSAALALIELRGKGALLEQLRVREKDGDETVMTFSAVRLGRHFSPQEERRIFGFREGLPRP